MKIVHLGFNHRYNDIRIFEKECVSLAKCGYEVVYITSSNNSPALGRIRQKGVKIIVIPVISASFYIRLLQYLSDARKEAVRQNADIYHIHEVWFLPLIPCLQRIGKVIYDSHEDAPRDHFERQNGKRTIGVRIAENLFEMYENRKVRRVSGIIAATPYIARRFRKIHKNVVTIANYPLIENLKAGNDARKENIIFYAGGITKMNGILNVIKAMEQIDGTLVLAGEITEEFRAEACGYKGWKKVRELGFLSKEEVAQWYEKSRCGVLLYLPYQNNIHAMPNKLFEYMACGIPVVASDFALWKKYLEEGQCGICVDPQDSKQIAQAVNRLLWDQKLCKEMGRNGRKIIEKKYRWDKEEKKLAEFYERIQNSKSDAGGNGRRSHYECIDYCKRHSRSEEPAGDF